MSILGHKLPDWLLEYVHRVTGLLSRIATGVLVGKFAGDYAAYELKQAFPKAWALRVGFLAAFILALTYRDIEQAAQDTADGIEELE